MKPPRGYEALRSRRVTIPGASYFLTLCTRHRALGLNSALLAQSIRHEITTTEEDMVLTLRALVIMPDHLHALLTVSGRLEVGQIVGRLKSKTRGVLRATGLGWQGNAYEHRLRAEDSVEEVLRYIYLNPYRAGLLPPTEAYSWFWLGPDEAAWFSPTLDEGLHFPAWLA